MRRVIQITPALAYGDGVGNDVLAIHKYLNSLANYEAFVYCEHVDERIKEKNIRVGVKSLRTKKKDIVILHLSTESAFNKMFPNVDGYKLVVYHNVTPPHFFDKYNQISSRLCENGLREVKELAGVPDYCLADSTFNKYELEEYGYTCPIEVLPIIIPFEDYAQSVDQNIYSEYNDGKTNILFTGRIAPNKKQEDIIESFYYYQKYYNQNSRLILVGNTEGMEVYYGRLRKYCDQLGVKDVVFTQHISFKGILACYKAANLFLCMSEHEGFCIPIVEAMIFELPIIAYRSCAVPETLGDGGILLDDKNPVETAAVMDYVLNHAELRSTLIQNQKKILQKLQFETLTNQLMNVIDKV